MFNNATSLPGYESMLLQKRSGLFFPGGVSGLSVTNAFTAPKRASSHLYAGKWTLEEERYVTFLCEEFRAGSLDIPEGKSLRCFLADQLGCNAKRISKKYERTGYNGKLQYVDKRSTMSPEVQAARQAELSELQRKFRDSRETLKIVEASRKRTAVTQSFHTAGPAPIFDPSAQQVFKKQKTGLLSSVATTTPHSLRMAALGGATATTGSVLDRTSALGGLHVLGAAPATCAPTTMMETLLLRRSILARSAVQQNNDLIRASMLSALSKYGAGSGAAPATSAPAPAAEAPTTSLQSLSSVAAMLDPPANALAVDNNAAASVAGLLAMQKRASLSLPGATPSIGN